MSCRSCKKGCKCLKKTTFSYRCADKSVQSNIVGEKCSVLKFDKCTGERSLSDSVLTVESWEGIPNPGCTAFGSTGSLQESMDVGLCEPLQFFSSDGTIQFDLCHGSGGAVNVRAAGSAATESPFESVGGQVRQNVPTSSIGDDFLFGTLTSTGPGSRLLYDHANSSFRSGTVTGIQWDPVNVGDSSFATGTDTTALGSSSHAEGESTAATSQASHSEGIFTNSSGTASHAEGSNTLANNASAHAEGSFTVSSGNSSHAEGLTTRAIGDHSHSEGEATLALAPNSHTEGSFTTASGVNSHAEGLSSAAVASNSHAEGQATLANGNNSHAEGSFTTSNGDSSHSEGLTTRAFGAHSHSEGEATLASNNNSHSEGSFTTASGANSHAEGLTTIASSDQSHAEGHGTIASNINSHSEGFFTTASGINSHSEGASCRSNGDASHSEGRQTHAFAVDSHSEGRNTTSLGIASHAEGLSCVAVGDGSHAQGYNTQANGFRSHSQGEGTIANGDSSHAEGAGSQANGIQSHAQGLGTIANGSFSHAAGFQTTSTGIGSFASGISAISTNNYDFAHGEQIDSVNPDTLGTKAIFGRYGNISDSVVWNGGVGGLPRPTQSGLYIANGSPGSNIIGFSVSSASDTGAHIGSGTMAVRGGQYIADLASVGFVTGHFISGLAADVAELFEFGDPSQNLRCRMVTFCGDESSVDCDKIRLAESTDDYVLGAVSKISGFLGNNSDEWHKKYEVDEFGDHIVIESYIKGFIESVDNKINALHRPETKSFQSSLFDDVASLVNDETNYDAVKADIIAKVNASNLFTDEEKANIVDTNIAPKPSLKISSEYDPSLQYVQRTERPEWAAVGLIGQLAVEDDGTCVIGGYAKISSGGKVTISTDVNDLRWRVIRRHSSNVVRILFR